MNFGTQIKVAKLMASEHTELPASAAEHALVEVDGKPALGSVRAQWEDQGEESAQGGKVSADDIEWTGPHKDQHTVLPDGRKLRVWWADPRWKSSIGEKKACPRGVDYPSRDAARTAVLKEAGIS